MARRDDTGENRRAQFRFPPAVPEPTDVAPVLAGAVEIGLSPEITPGTYGELYALYRDGVAVGGATDDLTLAQARAYVYVAADIGPDITWEEYAVTAGTGAQSNAITFAHATYLSGVAIFPNEAAALTLADSNTTVQAWAALYGGATAIFSPLAAPADTNRPAYSAAGGVGGRPKVVFDGIDNVLTKATATKGSGWTSYEFGAVVDLHTDGANGDIVMAMGSLTAGQIRRLDEITSTRRHFASSAASAVASVSTTAYTALAHFSCDWAAGGNQSIRVAGTAEDADANDKVSFADGSTISVGAAADGSAGGGNDIHAFYYCTAQLTNNERTHLRALLTYLTGVAC